MEGYDTPPPSYIPDRPRITDHRLLSPDIIRRLYAFGYTDDDIASAFNPDTDYNKPNPVQATYFLLVEMLYREKVKLQKIKMQQQMAAANRLSQLSTNSDGMLASPPQSASATMAQGHHPHIATSRHNREFKSLQELGTKPGLTLVVPTSVSNSPGTPISPLREIPGGPISASPVLPSPAHTRPEPLSTAFPYHSQMSISSTGQFDDASIQRRQSMPLFVPQYPSTPSLSINTNVSTTGAGQISPPKSATLMRPKTGTTSRIKEELRAMSGWFMNMSTTSQKPADTILFEIKRALNEFQIHFQMESPVLFNCQVEVTKMFPKNISPQGPKPWGSQQTPEEEEDERQHGPIVGMQIELVKVSKANGYGLHFKRVQGGVWNYKKVCQKLLSSLDL